MFRMAPLLITMRKILFGIVIVSYFVCSTGNEVDDREQSVLSQMSVLHGDYIQECRDNLHCVPTSSCHQPGAKCDGDDGVCCSEGDLVLMTGELETRLETASHPEGNSTEGNLEHLPQEAEFRSVGGNRRGFGGSFAGGDFIERSNIGGQRERSHVINAPRSRLGHNAPFEYVPSFSGFVPGDSHNYGQNYRQTNSAVHGRNYGINEQNNYPGYGLPGARQLQTSGHAAHGARVSNYGNFDHGNYGTDNAAHVPAYGAHSRAYGGSPHGFSEYNALEEPYYGSFNHLFSGEFGKIAPDYYSAQYDARELSIPAREVLHKYRYKKQCGVKPHVIFPVESYDGHYGTPVQTTTFGNYPWQAAVLGWSVEGYGLRCSATLVHPFLLLTSAKCLGDIVESELKIVLGVTDLLSSEYLLPPLERHVDRIFIHEQYDQATLSDDVALLQLSSQVHLPSAPHVTTACLPTTNATFVASKCYLVGWSPDHYHGGQATPTNAIKATDIKFVQSKQECQQKVTQATGVSTQLNKEMHCVTGVNSNSCMASAGGALFCDVDNSSIRCAEHNCPKSKTYLAGLVSWSNERCGKEGLAVLTEISPYVRWINDLLAGAGGFSNFNPNFYGQNGGVIGQHIGHGFEGSFSGLGGYQGVSGHGSYPAGQYPHSAIVYPKSAGYGSYPNNQYRGHSGYSGNRYH